MTIFSHSLTKNVLCYSFIILIFIGLTSCEGDPENTIFSTRMIVSYNPYDEVNWSTDYRLKAQHHDHSGTIQSSLLAYDNAGYDVVSLMTYSGLASLRASWKERRWPPENWLSQSFINSLQNIKFFIPNGEEVGYSHITSQFLTTYIAKWETEYYTQIEPWHYSSTQECITLINQYGGIAFLAHPWDGDSEFYNQLNGYKGVEIYSAFALARQLQGSDPFYSDTDRNAVMVEVWDQLLLRNQYILGIAVNDHYGPDCSEPLLDNHVRDSGKILVFAHEINMQSYRNAIEQGAVFAVKDIGEIKDRYPDIREINVDDESITITTTDQVTWIANGSQLITGETILFNQFPVGTVYVRAEIENTEGSKVYTQAFVVSTVKN